MRTNNLKRRTIMKRLLRKFRLALWLGSELDRRIDNIETLIRADRLNVDTVYEEVRAFALKLKEKTGPDADAVIDELVAKIDKALGQ